MSTISVRHPRLFLTVGIVAALAATAWAVWGSAGTAGAQVPPGAYTHWYMKAGDIQGEATAVGHEGWSEIQSVSQSMVLQPAGRGFGSHATGQAGEIQISKEYDKASPKLMEALMSGQVIPVVTIESTYGGADGSAPQTYLRIQLKNAQVTSYQFSGSEGNAPNDSMSLSFDQFTVLYTPAGGDWSSSPAQFDWSSTPAGK